MTNNKELSESCEKTGIRLSNIGRQDGQTSNVDTLPNQRVCRRRFLQATAGLGVLSLTGTTHASNLQDREEGEEIWSFETGGPVLSSPTVVDGSLYIGSHDQHVYALDAGNGEEQWNFQTGWFVDSSPAVAEGTVYIAGTDGQLYALDTNTGEKQWEFELFSGQTGSLRRSPTVVNDTVYIASSELKAIDTESGEEDWTSNQGVAGSPTITGEELYIRTLSPGRGGIKGLISIDLTDGYLRWEALFEENDPQSRGESPTVVDDTVYVGHQQTVYALDTSDGSERWSFETGGEIRSSPTVNSGTLYVGSDDGHLYALNTSSGTEEWSVDTGGEVVSSPTVVNNSVFVGSLSQDEDIYAVNSAEGDVKWTFATGNTVSSSPVVVDGVLYIGSRDTNVYAIETAVSESSNGSRVRLQTLNHISGSVEIDDSQSNEATAQGFHPGEHGFGFDNWSGTKSWSVDGQDLQYDPADVSEENIRQLVEEVWPSEYGKSLLEPVVKYVYTQFNQGTLTDGHCYGMIHAAMEYFEDPSALPEAADSASDVPYPVGQYEAVGDDIRYYHQSQFFDSASSSSVLQEWGDFKSWVFSILLPGFADVDLPAEIEELRNAIDEYGFAPISLADPGNDDYHQVLGYDYEVAGDETTVFTYDPNESEGYYVDESVEFYRLEVDENGSPTMEYYFNDNLEPYSQFVSMSDVQRDADLREVAAGAVITALIGAGESAKTYLQAAAQVGEQQIRLMFAGLHSPAHLEVTGPDEATIIQPDRSEINESMEYTDVVYIFGAPTGDYSYEVVGEGEGEYTLEMVGASQDEVLVSEEVEGEITEGERHNVNVMIPDTGDAEISFDKEGNSSESGLVDIETIAGGGAVTAGLLYLAYRMKRDETEPK